MKLSRHILFLLLSLLFSAVSVFAQPGFKVDIEKPKPYQERKLKAEKTGEGKIKTPKLILQNLTMHFNYVFNANNKINDILTRAKEQHKDDYTQLLSFYNYDLNTTAADSVQLDSVIYKARTGILNHDLRNEWGDELYLLWGEAWHLRKKFDSAALLLQFINYAYAPQYEDGYYKYIGTHTDGATELSIATKEEKHFLHNNTVSRNNAFLWQIRTFIERGDLTNAGSLITTLRRDPAFPARLSNQLDEVEAYWNYKQKHWDSAAVHVLAALDGDYTKLEKARWNFLAAQLFERAGRPDEATKLYEKVVALTPDPIMEVYARLNLVRLSKNGGEGAIDKNVADLLKMARRDKYEDYRDIIYYMAAQMEMERNNISAATELLLKGAKFNNGNIASRNRAFLQVADVLFGQKKYIPAASFYDSVQLVDLADTVTKRVSERKAGLQKIVFNTGVVTRQDSLQHIAAMPAEEQKAFLKALVKKLRKEQGLKDEGSLSAGSSPINPLNNNQAPADLFSSQQKGDWYFYNQTLRTQGASQFKSTWGNRPNVDNWRRFAAVNKQILTSPDKTVDGKNPGAINSLDVAVDDNGLSTKSLLAKLPTTPEALQASNDSIRGALFAMGLAYLNDIEDYPSAISTFEELRKRFPAAEKMDEVLFRLSYAYDKQGNAAASEQAKKLLVDRYPASRFTAIVSTGKDPLAPPKPLPEPTKAYEHIYNLYIEGQFAEAEAAKRIADSTYKTTFWQPQLLYIEAVYYIKQRQDSVARVALRNIINQNSNKALTAKAINLINVLARRKLIEDELTRLQITRPSEDDSTASQPVAIAPPVVKKDTVINKPVVPDKPKDSLAKVPDVKKPSKADSIALAKLNEKRLRDSLAAAKRDSIALARKEAAKAHTDSLARTALLAQQRKDSLALAKKEAAKAHADSLARKALLAQRMKDSIAMATAAKAHAREDSLALRAAMLKQATDSAALRKYYAKRAQDSLARIKADSLQLAKQKAAQALRDSLDRKALATKQLKDSLAKAKAAQDLARRDSIALAKAAQIRLRDSIASAKRDSIALAKLNAKPKKDTVAVVKPPEKKPEIVSPLGYTYRPAEAHYAVVVLNKVDPIFVGEAKNAFFRYNKENYYKQPLDVQILNLSADVRLLLVSGLPTAAAATDYATKAKELAATEIIPWLTGNKYSFSIISASNLEILKTKTEMGEYQKFLEQHLPGKF